MWLFSETGFVSAVVDSQDKNKIVVRSRDKESLRPLMEFAGVKMSYPKRATDYPHRVVVTRQQYADWVLNQIEEMQYTNYKNRVHQSRGDEFARPLHQVWSTMLQLEEGYEPPQWARRDTIQYWEEEMLNEYPSLRGR